MASKTSSSFALFLVINLLFFALVSARGTYSRPYPRPWPNPNPNIPSPNPNNPGSSPNPNNPGSSPTNPGTGPTNPSPSSGGTCPRDALQLGVCANVLNGLVNLTIGQPPVTPCCTLIQGLVDLEAAVCLCTAIRASILGINLNLPVSLSLLLNVCSRQVPRNFQCP